jgi:hypothetical protein
LTSRKIAVARITTQMANGGHVYRDRKNPRLLKAWTISGFSARKATTVQDTAIVVMTAAPPPTLDSDAKVSSGTRSIRRI